MEADFQIGVLYESREVYMKVAGVTYALTLERAMAARKALDQAITEVVKTTEMGKVQ